MTTPTTKPVPSDQPADLLFNAEALDAVLNSTAGQFNDRFGNVRRTLKGLTAEFPNAQANSDASALSASAASLNATAVAANLALAQAAAANAQAAGEIVGSYPTLALANADLASIAANKSISVYADGANNGIWRKESGVLVQKSTVTPAGIDAQLNPVAPVSLGRVAALSAVTGTLPAYTYLRYQPAPSSGLLTQVFIEAAAAGAVALKIYDRVGNVFKLYARQSVAVPTTGAQSVSLPTPVVIKAGQYVAIFDAAGVVRYRNNSGVVNPVCAFYESSAGDVDDFSPTAPSTLPGDPSYGNDISYGVFITAMSLADAQRAVIDQAARITALETAAIAPGTPRIGEVISAAAISIASGNIANASATLLRDGTVVGNYAGALVVPLSAASKVRYDLVYLDALTATFGRLGGTERNEAAPGKEPGFYSPEASLTATQIVVGKLRVTSSSVAAILTYDIADGAARALAAEMNQRRARSRDRLPKFRARASAGRPLRIIGLGDSITAIQYAAFTTALTTSPNGTNRDRGADNTNPGDSYLPVNYAADTLALIPKYTAVQLGRADDGAGAVHTRIGWNWSIVTGLEARGYTLGTDLFYDNFAIAGQQTSGLVTGVTPSTWFAAVLALLTARVAAGEAVLVVFSMGMNELGNTGTGDRVAEVVRQLKAAGAEVLVVSLTRPLDSFSSLANRQYTNNALARAAEFTKSAFAPIFDLVDGERLRAMGIFAIDLADANNLHHPGTTEHQFYGAEVARHVLGGL